MRILRWLLISGSAAAVAGALVFATGAAAPTAAGPARSVHAAWHPSAKFLSEARANVVSFLRHARPTLRLVRPGAVHTVVKGTGKAASVNWSGYVDTNLTSPPAHGTFTKVSASWTVPKVTCTPEDRIDSDWVGLDGAINSTVEQDGTTSQCFEGHAVYYDWYEMYPKGTIEVSMKVKAGNKVSATVSRSGSAYTLSLTDHTTSAASFTKHATCSTSTCLDQSAEWIIERPAYSDSGIVPLAVYAKTTFSAASQTHGGKAGSITGYTNYNVTMRDSTGSYDLSTMSGLTGGNKFTGTWHNSY
jgi:Peptidase A4 family